MSPTDNLVAIRDLCTEVRSGYWGSGEATRERTVRVQVVRNGDIAGSGTLRGTASRWFTDAESSRSAVDPGDVLFASSGDIGKIHLATGASLHASNFIKILRPDRKRVEPRFLRLLLSHPDVSVLIARHAGGSTIRNLRMSFFSERAFRVPAIEDQVQISNVVDDWLSRIDVADALVETAGRRLPSWRRAMIDRCLNDDHNVASPSLPANSLMSEREQAWRDAYGARPLPTPVEPDLSLGVPRSTWPVTSLEAATNPVRVIRYGILKPRVPDSLARVPYVEVKDLAGNTLNGKTLHRTSSALHAQFLRATIQAGDVVMAVRGSYERSAVVPAYEIETNISRDVARIAPLPSVLPEYVHAWLQGSFAQTYFKRQARGVAVKGVNISSLRALPIAIPPVILQGRMVAAVQEAEASAERLLLASSMAVRHARNLQHRMLKSMLREFVILQHARPTGVLD